MFISLRPGLKEFIEKIKKTYEVFIFTSSDPKYARKVIDFIAPDIDESHRFYFESCKIVKGYKVKDLEKIERPLTKVILVDDSSTAALCHPMNLVRIISYEGDMKDNVLLDQLLPALESFSSHPELVIYAHEQIATGMYPSLFVTDVPH